MGGVEGLGRGEGDGEGEGLEKDEGEEEVGGVHYSCLCGGSGGGGGVGVGLEVWGFKGFVVGSVVVLWEWSCWNERGGRGLFLCRRA